MLLMDQPFCLVDALTRAHSQGELFKIVVATKSTVVMVPHDVDDAVPMSGWIVVSQWAASTIGEIVEVS